MNQQYLFYLIVFNGDVYFVPDLLAQVCCF